MPFEWTAADQQAVDRFEREILAVAENVSGFSADALVLGFIQALCTLIQRRLQADPAQLGFYARMLRQLVDHALPLPVTPAAPSTLQH